MRTQTRALTDVPPGGEAFAKYVLVGELAQGGMGEIFLAIQQGLEGFSKVVVVKRLLRHLTADRQYTRMFIDEARLSARLEHANIVRTYEFGEHNGQYYTVMEFLAGEDLGKVQSELRGRSALMALPFAVHIAIQLCNGVHFAHELTDSDGRPLGLVHRDINPANTIITYAGEVKIIDFGVAKVDSAAIKTATGMLKGKFSYMSPEYIRSHGLDRRSDVFSAGIVLWELLTGRALFSRDTTASTIYAVMDDPVPPPSLYRPEVPPALDAIVLRALARAPAERFATADAMREALDEVAGALPKVDGRGLGRMMEELFGSVRAQAMGSIAQARQLAHNIPLVTQRPTTMPVSSSLAPLSTTVASPIARHLRDRRRGWVIAGAIAGVVFIVAVAAIVAIVALGRRTAEAPVVRTAPAIAPVDAAVIAVAPVPAPPVPEPSAPAPSAPAPSAPAPSAPAPSAPPVAEPPVRSKRIRARPIAPASPGAAEQAQVAGSTGSSSAATRPIAPVVPAPHDPGVAPPVEPAPPPVAVVPKPEAPAPVAPPAVDLVKQREAYNAAVRAAMRSQSRPIQQCYERARMDDSNLRGTVVVQLTIAADGAISNVQVSRSTLGSFEVEGCITREVAQFHLPRPSGGAAVPYTYTFVF